MPLWSQASGFSPLLLLNPVMSSPVARAQRAGLTWQAMLLTQLSLSLLGSGNPDVPRVPSAFSAGGLQPRAVVSPPLSIGA
jgi:hypothetical protein